VVNDDVLVSTEQNDAECNNVNKDCDDITDYCKKL